jgi:hypothetical protein
VFLAEFGGGGINWIILILLFFGVRISRGSALRLLSPVIPSPQYVLEHDRREVAAGRLALLLATTCSGGTYPKVSAP